MRKICMRFGKTLAGAALVTGFAVLPLSSALAYYPCNPVTGVFGAAATVAGAAVTIGTAPLVILAGQQPRFHDYTCGDHRYYHASVAYEGAPPGYYYAAPPPAAYYARPHRPRWYWRHGYDYGAAPVPPPPPPG
jgi:hypothetical protein